MNERPTPETDIIAADDNPLFRPWRRRICAHSRKLERQRDELLEALKHLLFLAEKAQETAPDCGSVSVGEIDTICRAAIAKVKGNQ